MKDLLPLCFPRRGISCYVFMDVIVKKIGRWVFKATLSEKDCCFLESVIRKTISTRLEPGVSEGSNSRLNQVLCEPRPVVGISPERSGPTT